MRPVISWVINSGSEIHNQILAAERLYDKQEQALRKTIKWGKLCKW
jgi:hypothetical protein